MSNKTDLYDSIPLEKDQARSSPTDKQRLAQGHIKRDMPVSKQAKERTGNVGKAWSPKGRRK